MYTPEQVSKILLEHTGEIAALRADAKLAHKRIDETDRITASIHELAKNVATMAARVESLTERLDRSVDRIEQGQQSQGKRIGNIEKTVSQIERNEKELMRQAAKIEAIEREPANKWKALVGQVTALVVAAAIGALLAKLM